MDLYYLILIFLIIKIFFLINCFSKGKFTYKDGKVYEGFFEEDKMTDTPTFNRTSKISDQISKIKARIPSGNLKLINFKNLNFFNFNYC